MAIFAIIICVILWLFIQAAQMDAGGPPRTRGSFRYQRRKARQLGLDVEDVSVRPRGALDYQRPPEPHSGSYVGDLVVSLLWTVGFFIITGVGCIAIMSLGGDGDLLWVWMGIAVVGNIVLWRAYRARR